MIIETGNWNINDDNELTVVNRAYTSGGGYILWRESPSFTFKAALKSSVLNLTYRKEGDTFVTELWRRVK